MIAIKKIVIPSSNRIAETTTPWRPTREQLAAAKDKLVPDLIAPGLRVLFAGINPGLYTAAVGHHFARPGNRFWPALYAGGFTPRIISPFEEHELLAMGLGISNVVNRASATADQLTTAELIAGAKDLEKKVKRYKPVFLAILGVGAYRTGFAEPKATVGRQIRAIGSTQIWILPNPSGLNAHYQPADLAKVFRELRDAAFG
jgi:TDG/mug DNA glycosylase family protein